MWTCVQQSMSWIISYTPAYYVGLNYPSIEVIGHCRAATFADPNPTYQAHYKTDPPVNDLQLIHAGIVFVIFRILKSLILWLFGAV